jgi:hypothetical protein
MAEKVLNTISFETDKAVTALGSTPYLIDPSILIISIKNVQRQSKQ